MAKHGRVYKSAKRRKELLRQKKQAEKRNKRFAKKTETQQDTEAKGVPPLKATTKLDTVGLNSPENILKIASASTDLKEGTRLEVFADSPNFEKDVSLWCEVVNKKLLWIEQEENGKKRCLIQF